MASGNHTLRAVAMPTEITQVPLDQGQVRRVGWIVSPIFDLLFIANIYWVLALLPIYVSSDGEPYAQFWMAYFLATPHRWLTLVVAAADPDRRRGQTWLFVLLAIAIAVLMGVTVWATGEFRHLFLFYTLILGFHFAGQHRFVWKIYASRARHEFGIIESWLPLGFIVYTNIRLIAFIEPMGRLFGISLFTALDWIALTIPIFLLCREFFHLSWQRLPKLLYVTSCLGLWSAVLLLQHFRLNDQCSVLLGGVTMFHSVEYLALVTYYAKRREHLGSSGVFQSMASNWIYVFAWYVVGVGLLYSLGNATIVTVCFAVNTWASLLHCAYDAFMWRTSDTETSEIFELAAPSADA